MSQNRLLDRLVTLCPFTHYTLLYTAPVSALFASAPEVTFGLLPGALTVYQRRKSVV